MKNGDRVTGQIVKKEGGDLVVKSEIFGEVKIPWSAVTSVESKETLVVGLPDGATVRGPVATEGGNLEVKAEGATKAAPLAQVATIRNAAEQKAYERLLAPGILDLWAGYFDFGVALARGNASATTLNTAFNANRATRRDKTTLYFNQIYARALVNNVSGTTAQAVRGGWAYNRTVASRLLVNFFNDYEYDRFQNLDLRFVMGGGLGFAAIKNDRQELSLLGGLAYNRESFGTGLTRNSAEAYWGDDWTYKLAGTTSLRQSYRMFNNLSNTGEYRINFDFGSATTLRKWLSLQVTISDRYLTNPLPGRKKNDILYTTGLRLSFAR